ncbi:MAG TPA: hypothetical protein VKS00_03060 [Candidatus Acidoferrales bacterium]|nr:hypothetical protein [Candidatus Acidoferrales bacterium]
MPVYSPSSRRSIRFPRYNYSQSGHYFFTLCAAGHKSILGRVVDFEMQCSRAGDAVRSVWLELPLRFPAIQLDAFAVMPNHVHGILFFRPLAAAGAASSAPTKTVANAPTLGLVLRAFKSLSAAAINCILHRTGPVWQRNYYEHIVRSGKDLDAVRLYIAQNPMQWLNDRENPETRSRLS